MVQFKCKMQGSDHRVPASAAATTIKKNVSFCGQAKASLALPQLHKVICNCTPIDNWPQHFH